MIARPFACSVSIARRYHAAAGYVPTCSPELKTKIVVWTRHAHSLMSNVREAALANGSGGDEHVALHNSGNRLFDPPLSATGRAHTVALKQRLKPLRVELVVSSPLRRALETATMTWDDPPLCILETLRERHSGHLWDSRLTRSEIAVWLRNTRGKVRFDLGGLSSEDDPLASPSQHGGGSGSAIPRESAVATAARGRRALRSILARPERVVAVVSHYRLLAEALYGARGPVYVRAPSIRFGPVGSSMPMEAIAAGNQRQRLQHKEQYFGHAEVRIYGMAYTPIHNSTSGSLHSDGIPVLPMMRTWAWPLTVEEAAENVVALGGVAGPFPGTASGEL